MKVIDLLNKIANSEEIPELVKYNGIIYNYVAIYRHGMRYIDLDETDENFRYLMFIVNNLNDELEIIEDTSEEDKRIKRLSKCFFTDYDDIFTEWVATYNGVIVDKLNEIIDKINGDSDE